MNQTQTTLTRNEASHITSPFARELHAKRFPHSAHREYQVGHCARTWLPHVGITCMAIGWVLAFTGIAISHTDFISVGLGASIGCLVGAVALIAFGVGWSIRDEGSEKGANDGSK